MVVLLASTAPSGRPAIDCTAEFHSNCMMLADGDTSGTLMSEVSLLVEKKGSLSVSGMTVSGSASSHSIVTLEILPRCVLVIFE